MTDLENRAFAFIQVHTLYDECKGKHYKDKTDFELMAEFAQSQLAEKDKEIAEYKALAKIWEKDTEQLASKCNSKTKTVKDFSKYVDELIQENIEKDKQIEELKRQLYSDNRNVFAELNDETAQSNESLMLEVADLKAQIEKMKNDVMANIKWADENKNDQMWQKLAKMYNGWN